MITNYLKIAIRSLFKHQRYAVLNVLGLSLAMATCLLLIQYVGYELSFDRFHKDHTQLYRVVNDRFQNGERVQKGTITYPTIGPVMAEEYPEIEAFTRLFYQGNALVHREKDIYRTSSCIYADQHFFELFSFNMLARSEEILLDEPFEMVITEKVARHFFDIRQDDFSTVLGETLEVDRNGQAYRIVGVCANFPANSHLQAEVLPSYQTFIQATNGAADKSWQFSDFYHYLKLQPEADIAALEAKFIDFSERHFQGEEVSNAEERFYLQPLEEAHLYSADLEYEIGLRSNGRVVWSMLGVALFILLLAWVNYINLASVRAIERAKEVGIRRIVGAGRHHLIGQFMTESALVNGFSMLLGVLFAAIAQPWFKNMQGQPDDLMGSILESGVHYILLAGLGVWLLMGITISGLYPALLLLRQRSTDVLKGTYKQSNNSQHLRRGLVVFQFAASIALISVTAMAFRQLRYLNQQSLGINISQMLRVSGPELTPFDTAYIERIQAFKEELTSHPDIEKVSTSSRVPGDNTGRLFGVQKLGSEDKNLTFRFIETDHDYEETYDLKPIAGRGLQRGDHHTDFAAIENMVINERGVKALGFEKPEAVIGQRLTFWNKEWKIVGVLPDFHQQSFHHPIEPIAFLPVYNNYQAFSVKANGQNARAAIQHIEEAYGQFFPGNIMEHQFMDQRFQRHYEADQQFGNILFCFTILAILIACMGVFGLASYMAFLRTKEIGIRKVLGASVTQIVSLLASDFVRLATIGALLAIPIAWYASRSWLQDFEYRIEIQGWVFVLGGLLAISLALLTVSLQSIKAALANPSESLKTE